MFTKLAPFALLTAVSTLASSALAESCYRLVDPHVEGYGAKSCTTSGGTTLFTGGAEFLPNSPEMLHVVSRASQVTAMILGYDENDVNVCSILMEPSDTQNYSPVCNDYIAYYTLTGWR